MPAGLITPLTCALVNSAPTCGLFTNIYAISLTSGPNALAAEIHRPCSGGFASLYYGAQLRAYLAPPFPSIPTIFTTPPSSPEAPWGIRVTWPAADLLGWVLESATQLLDGPWTTVATNSPFEADVTAGSAQFYRLQRGD